MTAGSMQAGVATYGRPRARRRVPPPQPVDTVCPACLTDQQTGPCPADCPERARRR
ncbi:hypothetical protein [Micromonospora wenchangensis]|uniref:hypothetical protein n=1 Tax=Micromonospora wenchangensis TaxID=1185415 RepID=UPI0037F9F182